MAGCSLSALVVAIVCSAAWAEEEPGGFDARLSEAEANVETEAGRAYYYGPFSDAFYQHYAGHLSECMQSSSDTEETSFELVIKLATSGSVEAALVRPESGFTACFARLVRQDSYPEPPSAHYWLPIAVVMTE